MNHVNLADEGDILVAISQSGTSKQVIQGLELGKEKGLKSMDYVLPSAGKEEAFSYYKSYAHLYETAVIDALLSFVTNEELIKTKQADKPEIMLSEMKM